MSEQTFRSPGFFDKEVDLSAKVVSPSGVPAGIIGTSEKGPAFVPVTVGSFADFQNIFGTLDANRMGPYAANEFLKKKTSLTYVRLLGAGANDTLSDISNTQTKGTVKNAGFFISGTVADSYGRHKGSVQFLVAAHNTNPYSVITYPLFNHNKSFNPSGNFLSLVRGVIFTATGTKLEILNYDGYYSGSNKSSLRDAAKVGPISGSPFTSSKYFKLVLSSSSGAAFANDESCPGVRILTASLDPEDPNYISKVLNTNPLKFQEYQHLLYQDFAVEHDLAPVLDNTGLLGVVPDFHGVALVSGSSNTSADSGDKTQVMRNAFGRFDTRYTTPKTPIFISQPYGKKEYDLFNFETISDGAYGNEAFKVSIANIRASTDENNPYGTFEVQLRDFSDNDTSTKIIERYPNCNLNPDSENYIARRIGDKKVFFDFDQEDPNERRLVISGKYPNLSSRIRIIMNSSVDNKDIPKDALPFGFRGVPVIKTSNKLSDPTLTIPFVSPDGRTIGDVNGLLATSRRLEFFTGSDKDYPFAVQANVLTGSIVPPIPFRTKVTRGAGPTSLSSNDLLGRPQPKETLDGRFYWGVKFERIAPSSIISDTILNPNVSTVQNPLISAYSKFQGIQKLDTLVTGTGADEFNNNKFTLARVAFGNVTTTNKLSDIFTYFTASAEQHMLEAFYMRDQNPDPTTYVVEDSGPSTSLRFTLASLVHTSSVIFNRFTEYNKFSTFFYGGFDGVNILDKDMNYFTDRTCSTEVGGKAQSSVSAVSIGLAPAAGTSKPQSGDGRLSNAIASYRKAVDIITDTMSSNINILVIPGIREPFITDYASDKVKEYSQAIYIMDSVKYDQSSNRLYDDSVNKPDVRATSEALESRGLDNSYVTTYFPDVYINDEINNKIVKVPASIPALSSFANNDSVSYPWYAPAGFNRGGLEIVKNVETRLNSLDRDKLYDSRINPIATFPSAGFVIFGQKTLLASKTSSLNRVNVRRLVLEVKRQVVKAASRLLFEQNNPQTRAKFVNSIIPNLALIQSQNGLEKFSVVMDETNNSQTDIDSNRVNGKITIVPTKTVEFIAIDFIITNSGVSFV